MITGTQLYVANCHAWGTQCEVNQPNVYVPREQGANMWLNDNLSTSISLEINGITLFTTC